MLVVQSNKDPVEVYNFDYLLIAKGERVPQKIMADRGAENINIAGSQRFLKRDYSDLLSGYQGLQFGKSMTNQRFASLQSNLHHSCTDCWIRFLKRAVFDGIYDTNDSLQV